MSDRPIQQKVDADVIPEPLRRRDQWVLWRFEQRVDGSTKVPVNPRTGKPAKTNMASTWASFDVALTALDKYRDCAGVGFVFTADDPFSGIDLDECLGEKGGAVGEAPQIIAEFDSYTEVSPSGLGLKIFIIGNKPEWAGCRSKNVIGFKEVEIYSTGRFFTVTGRRFPGPSPLLRDCQSQLDAICQRLWSPEPRSPARRAAEGAGFRGDDQALLSKATRAKNGQDFRQLFYDGDMSRYGEDHSDADLALCSHLAFWTARDSERMDRLFRLSALYRDKWDRDDYRHRTIAKAIEGCTDVYSSNHNGQAHATSAASLGVRQGKVTIFIGTDEHRVIDEAVAALKNDPDMYTRGTTLARIIRSTAGPKKKKQPTVKRPEGSAFIATVPTAHLRERLTAQAEFIRIKNGEEMLAHPPGWMVNGVEARGYWPYLRELVGVSESPFLRPDGTVCQTPGYDAETCVFHQPEGQFEPVPEAPTRDDAIRALGELREVVCDFRFEAPAHEAAWLASLLTPICRYAYEGPTPLFLFDANIRGAGKGLLCQVNGQIVLGRELPVSSYSHDTEELRKKITSVAIAGDRVVLLDNLEGRFGNDALDRALTTTRWKDRLLGVNINADVPLVTVWYATGNNVLVAADTTRRLVHIRLDVLDEKPEERKFKHANLLKWARENRPRLLRAALTIVVAYCRAGRPTHDLKPFGSFEGWSGLVRETVVWLGLPDPNLGREKLIEFGDTTADTLSLLVAAWQRSDPQYYGVIIADLITRLWPANRAEAPSDDASVSMRSALEQLAGTAPGRTPNARSVANRLKQYRRRPADGFYLDIDKSVSRRDGAVWKLFKVPNAGESVSQ